MVMVRERKPRNTILTPVFHFTGETGMRLGDALLVGVICHLEFL
jgi:hypothetical protein